MPPDCPDIIVGSQGPSAMYDNEKCVVCSTLQYIEMPRENGGNFNMGKKMHTK